MFVSVFTLHIQSWFPLYYVDIFIRNIDITVMMMMMMIIMMMTIMKIVWKEHHAIIVQTITDR